MQDSQLEYKKREEGYGEQLNQLKVKINRTSNVRLLTVVLGLGLSIYLYFQNQNLLADILLFVTIVTFIALVLIHNRLKDDAKMTKVLLEINTDSIKRINGEWDSFDDSGSEFEDYDHPFTSDLDIFGNQSLFKWMNTAVTYNGRRLLKDWLDTPTSDIQAIKNRQIAAKELSTLLDWRQYFQAEAKLQEKEYNDPQPLFDWAKKPAGFYAKSVILNIGRFLPLLTILLSAAAILLRFSFLIPATLIIVQMILVFIRYLDGNDILSAIDPFGKSIKAYRSMLELFETQEFSSDYLKLLQERLRDKKGNSAYKQVLQLERITDMLGVRHSQLYLVINILLLWDYQCLAAFEKWKMNSGIYLEGWIAVLAELEALASLAVISYDHPDWTLPHLYDDQPRLFASQIGHPLLPEDRVNNDIGIMREGQVYLITGSNMSGKSTLLRTIGINLVLAYAGAPVCAKEFHCSIFTIYTSMRIRDDLRSNISSFYAELLRIKKMIDAAKRGESVFFLLDEIFRGTNSRDRHAGARVLVKQLSDEGAVGLVSTHDVELGDLANENNKIKNYHFREDYIEGQLQFDYKLRPGISNTRNAVYLMKMAGITVPDDESQQA